MVATSMINPDRRVRRDPRGADGLVAASAARTAPRGPGLADVVPLPVRGGAALGWSRGWDEEVADRHSARTMPQAPVLRVVPEPIRPARRGVATVVGLVVALALVVGGIATVLTGGQDVPAAAGHVVLQPGETLWDIAVRSAPAGVDPRQQLDVLRRMNGFAPGGLDAWTVVLIPAR